MYDYDHIQQLLRQSHQGKAALLSDLLLLKKEGQPENVHQIIDKTGEHLAKFNPSPMWLETDLSGIILDVNDELCRASAYSREELIGEKVSILQSSYTEFGKFTDLWNTITAGRAWRIELQNRKKNYQTYWVDVLIAPVLDAAGKVVKYFSIAYDISELMTQKEEVEFKNIEMTESIKYARRIQKMILPSKKEMDDEWDDYFIIYKPKDVVSGDFYWFKRTVDKVFCAIVDCTGHGVPGAFMSLIANNLLNQIVLQQGIYQPGRILSELHKEVRATLKQDEEEEGRNPSRDGMDMSIVVISKFDDEVLYAGANRPLFWVHQGALNVVDPDKMSIGGEQLEEERVFTTQLIEPQDGDVFYMFSDGIVDQFGGPDQKKFGTKKLKQLVMENHHEKMSVQRALFNLVWKDWKADDEQIDDVTMMGYRYRSV